MSKPSNLCESITLNTEIFHDVFHICSTMPCHLDTFKCSTRFLWFFREQNVNIIRHQISIVLTFNLIQSFTHFPPKLKLVSSGNSIICYFNRNNILNIHILFEINIENHKLNPLLICSDSWFSRFIFFFPRTHAISI